MRITKLQKSKTTPKKNARQTILPMWYQSFNPNLANKPLLLLTPVVLKVEAAAAVVCRRFLFHLHKAFNPTPPIPNMNP